MSTFDDQILERMRHGHLPDLRRTEPCDWFYNNPWRRPYLADAAFGEIFRFYQPHLRPGMRLLEVGCGPGHMSLEFARSGCHVVGLDLSPVCIETARQTAGQNPYPDGFGSLRYVCADFTAWEAPAGSFDAVVFSQVLTLMSDPLGALQKANTLLAPGGLLLVSEPALDWMTPADAAIVVLIRRLLAAGGHWYESLPLPKDGGELREAAARVLAEYQGLRDPDEAERFPPLRGGDEVLLALRTLFEQIEYRPGYAFAYRVMGGVRGATEDEARRLAEFLIEFDREAVASGWLRPTYLYWAGRKH